MKMLLKALKRYQKMVDQLWEIAASLHTVIPMDRPSLDTLVGCTALIISIASQLENEKESGTKEE